MKVAVVLVLIAASACAQDGAAVAAAEAACGPSRSKSIPADAHGLE